MNKIIPFILISILFFNQSIGQENKHEPHIQLGLINKVNQGNSYITFPTDIGNIEPLMFEANVIPNFNIRKNKESRFLVVLTPQIILRMYNEYSLPVKTPSYMPQITSYYLIGNKLQKKMLTVFGRLAHHSNGQKNELVLSNGNINLESGDFSTNYIEFGGIVTAMSYSTNAVKFLKTSFEYHPENEVHRQLNGQYSRFRWHAEFSAFKLPRKETNNKHKTDINFDAKLTWLFGDLNNTASITMERLQASLTFSYYPDFLDEIGFFIQLYQGKDYYNVYFNEQRSMIRFGIMTDKLRF